MMLFGWGSGSMIPSKIVFLLVSNQKETTMPKHLPFNERFDPFDSEDQEEDESPPRKKNKHRRSRELNFDTMSHMGEDFED